MSTIFKIANDLFNNGNIFASTYANTKRTLVFFNKREDTRVVLSESAKLPGHHRKPSRKTPSQHLRERTKQLWQETDWKAGHLSTRDAFDHDECETKADPTSGPRYDGNRYYDKLLKFESFTHTPIKLVYIRASIVSKRFTDQEPDFSSLHPAIILKQ